MTQSIALKDIRIDGGTQPRVLIDEEAVGRYAEKIADGKLLPPVDIFFDGVDNWLADGFHRYHAGIKLGHLAITAIVHTGTKRDAVLFSVGANDGHGIQRTHADKRKAVLTLINDAEWGKWSGHEIARRCGVSHKFANELKAAAESSLEPSASEAPIARTYMTKHGTEATMKTANIGRKGLDKSRVAVAGRHERIREMATSGYSVPQIAAEVGLSVESLRTHISTEKINVVAQQAMGRTGRHDANRIVERMVMDAENLTADVNLIDFPALDRERLGEWADSLIRSKKSLDSFIRRLIKEQQKHGEAA